MSTNSSVPSTSNIQRQILQQIPIPALPGYESRLVLLTYPPGVNAPVHTHPVAATGYVLEGSVLSQWDGPDSLEEFYTAGDSFVDHGTRVHVRSENVSQGGTGVLRMLISYVIKVGEANVNALE
ncbi:uncharacterized protein AB675_8999 [Cyphellophora attinorum]|uniref:Cupin type-2 domain-containing protein n=1 Tax=Cyphellophora attinorum TaxID=1664694 RepID=A0A0N0NNT7_9EURO|nr:uncharacterized protein AB675_8999 [Phialophora attinorum]KPI41759.1 hypothetical protein AB675_8999 [Phialophora attinorum]